MKRLAGVLILGVLAAGVARLFLPFSLAELGLTVEIPPSTWLWVRRGVADYRSRVLRNGAQG